MQPQLQGLVTHTRELLEDMELTYVKEWKEKYASRKAIGYMPIYVPRELIHAAGMLPVGILGGGDQLEIIKGDAYFQSYICHIPRSTIELAVTGKLDVLDGMLFPSICDVIRNLSGMWSILFPKRYMRYVDVPQNFETSVGGSFYEQELRSILGEMAALSGNRITDAMLQNSIELYNENRQALDTLYKARSDRPWLFPTAEMYTVVRAGCILPPDEHTHLIYSYLKLAPQETDRIEKDHSRVVTVGSFCEQPPIGLLSTLERAGCWIVDDDLLLGLRWLQADVAVDGDPIHNLSEAFLHESASSASRYQPANKGRSLVESVEETHADGVIFMAPSFCDPALLDQPMLIKALDEAGIAHTQFKYSENTGQFSAIREQAGTFSDSIRLWSEA